MLGLVPFILCLHLFAASYPVFPTEGVQGSGTLLRFWPQVSPSSIPVMNFSHLALRVIKDTDDSNIQFCSYT